MLLAHIIWWLSLGEKTIKVCAELAVNRGLILWRSWVSLDWFEVKCGASRGMLAVDARLRLPVRQECWNYLDIPISARRAYEDRIDDVLDRGGTLWSQYI